MDSGPAAPSRPDLPWSSVSAKRRKYWGRAGGVSTTARQNPGPPPAAATRPQGELMSGARKKTVKRQDAIRLADVDLDQAVRDEATYGKKLARLQLRLLQIQQAYKRQGR